jgi:uncharacterized membrane protein
MMSIRSRLRSRLLLGLGSRLCALAIAAWTCAGCGSGLSSVLIQLSGIPTTTVRLNGVINLSGRTSTVTLERDASNRFIVSSAMLMPPMVPAPNSMQLALDLPAGTSGPVVVRFTVESGDPSVMTPPPPMPTVTHEGCGRVEIQGAMLYNLAIAVRSQPNPCPF